MNKFDLKKIKHLNGKVEAIFNETTEHNGVKLKEEHTVTYDRIPHPDLTAAMKGLSTYLADANNLCVHRDIAIGASNKKKWEGVEKILKDIDKQVYDSMTVSGIAIKGDSENMSVTITGTHKTVTQAMAMNTPSMSLNGDTYGFEDGLKKAVEVLLIEAKAYIVDGKSAQLQMFDKNEGKEPKEKAKKIA